MKVLLTGGTGFLGNYLVDLLSEKSDELYLLVRSKNFEKLQRKYQNFSRIKIIVGDISDPNLINGIDKKSELIRDVDTIIHAAAYYDLEGSYSDCFMYNVEGTQNVLYFAQQCENLKSFHYISTIAVSGNFSGVFLEDDLDIGQSFSNHYAKTKFDAEKLVRSWTSGDICKRIYRLGILVGNSKNGEISRVDGPYYFFQALGQWSKKISFLKKLKIIPLPFDPKSIFPIIPVDDAASVVLKGVFSKNKQFKTRTYHILSQKCPTLRDLIMDTFQAFGFAAYPLALPKSPLNSILVKKIGLPKQLLAYMYGNVQFDEKNLKQDFSCLERNLYSGYKDTMFDFAMKNFG